MSNVDQLKKLKEGLVLLSRDREVVFSFHETFKHVDELLEIVVWGRRRYDHLLFSQDG